MNHTPCFKDSPPTSANRFNRSRCYAALCIAGLSAATPTIAQEYDMAGRGFQNRTGFQQSLAYRVSVDGVSVLSRGVREQGDAGLRQMTDVARHYTLASLPEVEVTRGYGGLAAVQYGAFAVGEGLWGEDGPAGQAKSAAGTVGLLAQTNTGLHFGLGVQSAGLERTDGYLDGSVEADGYGGVAFAASEPQDTGPRAFATALVLELDADIDRNYLNGAAVETARGSTDGQYYGVDIELGYAFRMNDQISLTPLAGFEYGKANFDGYTETGGTFAGVMSDQSSNSKSARLGVASTYHFSDVLEMTGYVAVGQVSETLTAPGLAVTALSRMQFSGATGDRDYSVGYLTVGASYQFTPKVRLIGLLGGQRAFASSASDIDAIDASIGLALGF